MKHANRDKSGQLKLNELKEANAKLQVPQKNSYLKIIHLFLHELPAWVYESLSLARGFGLSLCLYVHRKPLTRGKHSPRSFALTLMPCNESTHLLQRQCLRKRQQSSVTTKSSVNLSCRYFLIHAQTNTDTQFSCRVQANRILICHNVRFCPEMRRIQRTCACCTG